MADVRPFRGLRYDPARAGDLDHLVAPPYDVISTEQQQALYNASPYNVVRLEYSSDTGDERYAKVGRLLARWRLDRVLERETQPAFYLYEQRFRLGRETLRRRTLVGRVRLTPFEMGIVRPHEFTMTGPKEDRFRLMQATAANISPVFTLYRPDAGDPIAEIERLTDVGPVSRATDLRGDEHAIVPLSDFTLQQNIVAFLAPQTLYIADGHHRYETALRYREERRLQSRDWNPEWPANFVMMGLTAADDPGLTILPIHRIVHVAPTPDLRTRIERFFDVADLPGDTDDPEVLRVAEEQLHRRSGEAAFIAAGLAPNTLTLFALRDRAAVEALMPAERSAAWKALDVNVLQYGVLEAGLGIDVAAITSGGAVEFTEDAGEAVHAVTSERATLAFLVNATRPQDIFATADAGDRMPQKSTYFYPKLGTGLVINPLD